MLRVVGGFHRGRKLEQPPKSITRPTMDRVKEAIFNMIQFKIKGSIVLDIFAGSGSLGIEAISRGAMKAIAVDKSKEAIEVLKGNVEKLGINNIDIVKGDVIDYLSHANGKLFDFIFMDPPFADFAIYNEVFIYINKYKLLKPNGLLILETKDPKKLVIPEGLTINRQKKYGISYVLLIANNI